MDFLPPIIFFLCGLIFGSFFNVLIYRLPREESIITPGSHCPSCGHSITPVENIPLVSFMILGGKCRSCKAKIPLRYPAVEFFTGCAALILWFWFVSPALSSQTMHLQTIAIAVEALALLFLIPVALIDAAHFIIPDIFTLPGLVVSIAVSFIPGGLTPIQCGTGVLAGGGSLFVAGLLGKLLLKKNDAMGGGDVRLMAFLGGLFGWKIALVSIFAASILGSLAGAALIFFNTLGKDHKIPFGPFLACGTWFAVMTIDKISAFYIGGLDRIINN
jgi:leader peptidase (prepilin peptidase)/N-methyltransferase